jgi:hypothetical protein
MSVIENQTPTPRKRRPYRHWRDWLVIVLALAASWCALCWLVQTMASR